MSDFVEFDWLPHVGLLAGNARLLPGWCAACSIAIAADETED